PFGIVAGDFDGDHHLDVAVANRNSDLQHGNVSILRGNGDGTLRPALEFPVGDNPEMLAAGDLNGDGKLDVVVENTDLGYLSVLLGNGDGTLQPERIVEECGANGIPRAVTIADLDGDGKLDVATTVTEFPHGVVCIHRGNGDGTFQPPTR